VPDQGNSKERKGLPFEKKKKRRVQIDSTDWQLAIINGINEVRERGKGHVKTGQKKNGRQADQRGPRKRWGDNRKKRKRLLTCGS